MEIVDQIVKSPVFRGLPKETLREALTTVRWQVKKYARGDVIASRGEDVANLMIVAKGKVQGVMGGREKRYIKIDDIPAPFPIATGFMFGEKHYFPVDVIASNEVTICFIPREDFSHMMIKYSVVQANFLGMISNRIQFLTSKISLLSGKSLKAKLAAMIVQYVDAADYVVMAMSQQNAADLLGVARPSLARTFGELLEEGILEGTWKRFRIVRYPDLENYLSEADSP